MNDKTAIHVVLENSEIVEDDYHSRETCMTNTYSEIITDEIRNMILLVGCFDDKCSDC